MNPTFKQFFDNKTLSFDRLTQLQQLLAARSTFVIYFTPRSGSTYLADLLRKSSVAGLPREYFNPLLLPRLLQGIESKFPGEASTLFDYMIWLLQNRSSGNGAFGLKVAYPHLRPLVESGLDRLLLDSFVRFFLTRQNLLNQAISLYVMTETQLGHQKIEAATDLLSKVSTLAYDGARIRHHLVRLWNQELSFRRYFAETRYRVIELDYDGLSNDPHGVVSKIASACGIQCSQPSESDFRRVRGTRSGELAAAFLDDPKSRAALLKHSIPESRLIGA
jgi:trehalose 2-sulfotransferase